MKKEIIYKNKTITVLFPSGMFEYYSDKEGRFLKFDRLKDAKNSIDKENKKMNESVRKISLKELRNIVNQVIAETESKKMKT